MLSSFLQLIPLFLIADTGFFESFVLPKNGTGDSTIPLTHKLGRNLEILDSKLQNEETGLCIGKALGSQLCQVDCDNDFAIKFKTTNVRTPTGQNKFLADFRTGLCVAKNEDDGAAFLRKCNSVILENEGFKVYDISTDESLRLIRGSPQVPGGISLLAGNKEGKWKEVQVETVEALNLQNKLFSWKAFS